MRKELDAIETAAYRGSKTRKPEDDVRWLLQVIDQLEHEKQELQEVIDAGGSCKGCEALASLALNP